MALATGTRLGAYGILSALGAGGMGEVYRARDTKLNRDVALKVLPSHFALDRDRLARFTREAQVLASLNHPHIAAIYGLEEANDLHALVLELVEGPTLADRIAQGPIPLAEAVPIALQITEALEAAHEQGIIHRDLKPANIKLRPDGAVKVLDFGLAKALDQASGSGLRSAGPEVAASPTITSPAMTGMGVILGTAAYMSPEQAKGRAVDKRTDVWAFGCVLYEMLTGRRAFAGDEVSETLAFVITKDIDWKALPPDTPAPIRRLLGRCLEKSRQKRLRDIGDASFDLTEALTAPAPEASVAVSPRRALGRVAALIVAGGVLGAAIAGALLWTAWPAVAPETAVVRRFGISLPDTVPFSPGANATRDVAVSPDGTRLAFIGTLGQLNFRSLTELDTIVSPKGLGPVRDPFFSPDGEWLGFFTSGTSEMKKVSISGGPALAIASSGGTARGASWGADGTIVFATNVTSTGLLRVPSAGGTPEVLTTPDAKQGEIDHLWPEILPGGRAVLYTITSTGSIDNAQIAVLNLETRDRKVVLRGGRFAQYVPSGHLVFGAANGLHAVRFDLDRLEVTSERQPILEQVATTASGAVNAVIARDGTLVYVPGAAAGVGLRTLVWVDRKGHEEPIGAEPRAYQVPRVSLDGTRVAAQVEDPASPDIVVYDLERKTTLRLTLGESVSIRPAWTPDSRWVLFRSDLNGTGIDRKAADGHGAIERLTAVKGDGGPHSVSPDGKTLVFSQVDPVTGRDLWMLDLTGDRTPRPLIVAPRAQSNAVISPDGHWLAYHSEDVGAVLVRPFPDVAGGSWEVVASGAKWPLWSRDGRELFYVTERGVMAADIDTSQQSFRWKSPRLVLAAQYSGFVGLVGARNYDLSPDGTRFLMIKDAVRQPLDAPLVVVLNWHEELKTRVPAK